MKKLILVIVLILMSAGMAFALPDDGVVKNSIAWDAPLNMTNGDICEPGVDLLDYVLYCQQSTGQPFIPDFLTPFTPIGSPYQTSILKADTACDGMPGLVDVALTAVGVNGESVLSPTATVFMVVPVRTGAPSGVREE